MKIKDKVKPKTPPLAPGVYLAICIGVIDLGEQYSEKFKNYSKKVQIVWEIPSETIEVDGKQEPRQLSKDFTFSSSAKGNLRAFISSWNSKQYSDDEFPELDLFGQIGKPCQLNVVLNSTGEYSNIDNIMPLPKGFPAPVSNTAPIMWDIDDWNDELFASLPEWVQEKIKKSTEYQKEHAPVTTVEVMTPETAQIINNAGGGECPI